MAYVQRNYEKNGIEIYFDKKPSEAVRDILKANGWRWSGFSKCWYNFYTMSNMSFAESLCGSGTSSFLYDEEKKEIKTTKVTHPKVEPFKVKKKKEEFSEGDKVLVTTDKDRIHVGEVDTFYESLGEVYVIYIISTDDGEEDTESDFFKKEKVKKISRVLASSINEGRIVSFVNRYGEIKKAEITDVGYLDNRYDVVYYEISQTGEIDVCEEENVSLDRIIEVEYGASIFPVKLGDKVEFQSSESGFTTGKVTYINSDSTVDIEYEYIDSWGEKDTTEDVYIELSDIHIMVHGKKIVERSLCISPENQRSIDANELIKKRIKDRGDQFVDARYLVQNKSLYRHQKAGTILAEMYNKFAFFYDTGTGKTVMALDIITAKQKKDNARFLIIAPKSIIKTAWMDDAAKYYPALRILPIYKGFNNKKKRALLNSWKTGGRASNWESDPIFYAHVKLLSDAFELGELKVDNDVVVDEALSAGAQHYIINSELFIRDPDKYIDELGITGIVMDESAILKNYNGRTSQVMREVAEKMKYVYLLSGKPAPNNVIEYFSQMKVVDPETFNMSYDRFLNMFCYSSNRKYYMYPANEKLFAEMVSIKSLIISKNDCLDLPETIDVVRQIEIPEDIMGDYNELYRECMTIIKGMDNSQVFYSAQSKLAVLMKLRQMASGFFMVGSGDHKESQMIVDIHDSKIEELNSVLDQIEDEQVIIWCQFQHEIEMIEQELSKRVYTVTAYGKTKDLEKNIDDFKTGKAQYIVAHPKTLKYGVTFVNCKYTVYYSFSYSAEDYDQSHDRNYRLGQTEKCTYIYIQAADTIDEIMFDKVMNKLSNAEFFERLIKDAAKHGIDYDLLKQKNDEEIRTALKDEDGDISTISREIVERSNSSKRLRSSVKDGDYYTSYEYLSRIEEPSDAELMWIENVFLPDKQKHDIDSSRPDFFDYVHADEQVLTYSRGMSEEDFRLFLLDVDKEEQWVYQMYREVERTLRSMNSSVSDVLTEKYGLLDGKKRSNATIADKFRRMYGTEYGYTWNTARVADELKSGLYSLSYRGKFATYIEKIKELLS